MASWLNISDYKFIDFGTVPNGYFLYHKLDYDNGVVSDVYRVLYANLPITLKDIIMYQQTLLKFSGSGAVNGTLAQPGGISGLMFRYRIFIYIEMYANKIDINTLSTTNNPDGTGLDARANLIFEHANSATSITGNYAASLPYRIAFIGSRSGSNFDTYKAMRVSLYGSCDAYKFTSETTFTATGLSILNKRLGFQFP